jgi:hypothetical protein
MKMTHLFGISAVTILIAFGAYFGMNGFFHPVPEPLPPAEQETGPVTEPRQDESAMEVTGQVTDVQEGTGPQTLTGTVTLPAPFILQAPGAKWGNPIFQDGCEEASMLMAMGWVRNTESVAAAKAATDMTTLAGFEVKRFGYHQDVSLPEIVSILWEYFQYDRALLLEDITLSDIRQELSDGNIVLAPTFGGGLGNPFFTPPGPITHMLVLTGYDKSTKEFIVNDPGTRRGENYRYTEDILFESLWAYPPGTTHPPIPSPSKRRKSVIVVRPSE